MRRHPPQPPEGQSGGSACARRAGGKAARVSKGSEQLRGAPNLQRARGVLASGGGGQPRAIKRAAIFSKPVFHREGRGGGGFAGAHLRERGQGKQTSQYQPREGPWLSSSRLGLAEATSWRPSRPPEA